MVKQRLWWSRPSFPPWTIGVRPNSPPHTTSVSSSRPRCFRLLSEDAFHPSLRTHKLKGGQSSSWSCSAGYDLRILFEFESLDGTEAILVLAVGTHDEVY